jgi:hypothetical protein
MSDIRLATASPSADTANPRTQAGRLSVGGEELGKQKRSTKIYFVLPIVRSGSTVSASSGGQLRKSVVRKTKRTNRGKQLWDYSIQYSVQLVGKVMILAKQLR